MASKRTTEVYLETGAKRTFAAAVDWPGWCRGGRDEAAALQALVDYVPRYVAAVQKVAPDFRQPARVAELETIERLKGNATTDFGAPGVVPALDRADIDEQEVQRLLGLLDACWATFERSARSAKGKTLAAGPRGGGRSLPKIREHVEGAHAGYTRQLGGGDDFSAAVWTRWRGDVPDQGPRGGQRWPPRYAIRRAAWHILDHAWEIEDRLGG